MIQEATTYRKDIYRIISDCVGRAEGHFGKTIGIPNLSFELKSNRIAGSYSFSSTLVKINPFFLTEHPDYILNQTVPHEVAHHITRKIYGRVSAHGPEWKHVMRVLGLAPNRCHSLKLNNPPRKAKVRRRYSYECPSCNQEYRLTTVAHKREGVSRIYRCASCQNRSKIIFTGKVYNG